MTEALLESAVPVFEVEGTVKGELARDLVRLEVREATDGLKTLVARFLGHGPRSGAEEEVQLYLDGAIFDFGRRLKASIGPEGDRRTIFDGFISGIEAGYREGDGPEVVVFAEDRMMRLRMTRRMKTYKQVSDADLVQAIAGEHGMTAQTDADGPTYDVVQQWNQSDLAFLRERAQQLQAEIWYDDGKLYFMTRTKRPGTSLTLVRGNHLLEVEARADLAHQRTKVKVSGYSASDRDAIDEEAGTDAVNAEVSGGGTGPDILQRAFGERVSYRVREAPLETGEARAWAKAEMLRRARAFVTVAGTTRGSPDMVVGSRLTLQRVGHPFDGDGYYVTSVTQRYDLIHGHRTHFTAERATVQEGA